MSKMSKTWTCTYNTHWQENIPKHWLCKTKTNIKYCSIASWLHTLSKRWLFKTPTIRSSIFWDGRSDDFLTRPPQGSRAALASATATKTPGFSRHRWTAVPPGRGFPRWPSPPPFLAQLVRRRPRGNWELKWFFFGSPAPASQPSRKERQRICKGCIQPIWGVERLQENIK